MSNAFDNLDQAIDDIATYLMLAAAKKKGGGVNLNYFSGIEVFVPGMMEQIAASQLHREMPGDVMLKDLTKFDVSLMMQMTEAPGALCALQRWKRVGPKDVRGRVTKVMPYMLETGVAGIWRDGKSLVSEQRYFGSFDDDLWRCIGPTTAGMYGSAMVEVDSMALLASMNIHFLRDYDWGVHLGYVGYPTINFPTDPTGVLEVFRLRDIPEGKTRRAALLHWVKEHWRQSRNDDAALTRVKEHMRGQRTFVWNDLHCTIKPSPHDVRRLQATKEAS
jgi:hypothetical protein